MLTRAPRLAKKLQQQIFEHFVDDLTAKGAVVKIGRVLKKGTIRRDLSGKWIGWHENFRRTVNRYYRHYRETIREHQLREYPRFAGEVEIDIGFFGGRAAKWTTAELRGMLGLEVGQVVAKRCHFKKQLARKRPVLGIMHRGGNVFLLPLESRVRKFLEGATRMIVVPGTIVYSDMEGGLKEIGLDGYLHRTINKSKGKTDRSGYHINGIESFWRECRTRMTKNFRGVPRSTLDLHIKECEFRYNHRRDLEDALKAILSPARKPALK